MEKQQDKKESSENTVNCYSFYENYVKQYIEGALDSIKNCKQKCEEYKNKYETDKKRKVFPSLLVEAGICAFSGAAIVTAFGLVFPIFSIPVLIGIGAGIALTGLGLYESIYSIYRKISIINPLKSKLMSLDKEIINVKEKESILKNINTYLNNIMSSKQIDLKKYTTSNTDFLLNNMILLDGEFVKLIKMQYGKNISKEIKENIQKFEAIVHPKNDLGGYTNLAFEIFNDARQCVTQKFAHEKVNESIDYFLETSNTDINNIFNNENVKDSGLAYLQLLNRAFDKILFNKEKEIQEIEKENEKQRQIEIEEQKKREQKTREQREAKEKEEHNKQIEKSKNINDMFNKFDVVSPIQSQEDK